MSLIFGVEVCCFFSLRIDSNYDFYGFCILSDSVEAAQMDLDEIERRKQEAQKVESVQSSQSAMGSIPQTDPKSKPNDIDTTADNTADTNVDATATTESEQKDEAKTDENNTSTEDADKSTVDKLNEGRTIYTVSQSVKDCGNVFEGSRIFFEYVIDKEKRKQFQKLKALPFQVSTGILWVESISSILSIGK